MRIDDDNVHVLQAIGVAVVAGAGLDQLGMISGPSGCRGRPSSPPSHAGEHHLVPFRLRLAAVAELDFHHLFQIRSHEVAGAEDGALRADRTEREAATTLMSFMSRRRRDLIIQGL